MDSTENASSKQLELFNLNQFSLAKKVKIPVNFKSTIKQRYKLERHMSKFKPFREFGSPLVGLNPEAFLDYINKEISDGHLCKLVKEIVFLLDTEAIELKYSLSGQNSYHPKLLLSILFYGYATGVRSSRKLAEKCEKDFHFIYLMQCYTPDHRTISDFRKDNISEIKRYFVEILRIFDKLGYVEVGKIYVDGTKVRANASARRTKTGLQLDNWVSLLEGEIEKILQEVENIDAREDESCRRSDDDYQLKRKLLRDKNLKEKIEEAKKKLKEEDKKKINVSDVNANHMKCGGSKDIRPSYNCEFAVTEDGVITASEAVTEPNDQNQLQPMIEQTEINTNREIEEVTADSGFGNYENYEYLEEKEIEGYVPDLNFQKYKSGEYEKEENRYHYSNFKYDAETDSYVCPEGEVLKYWKTRKNKTRYRQWNHKVYKGTACESCSKRSLCTKSKVRELLTDIREPLLQVMRERLTSDEGKAKYFMRQYIIEPIFGHFKHNLGYRNFLLRGLEKINGELKLMCIGWNLKKMLKLGYTPKMIRNL